MKISNKITKFQEGGQMPPQAGPPQGDPAMQAGPPPQQGGSEQDPMTQIMQIAQQALEGQDCEAAMAVCDGLLQLVAASQGGGAPAGAEGSTPVYKRGGKLLKRI